MMMNRKKIFGIAGAAALAVSCGTGYTLLSSTDSAPRSGYCAEMSDAVGLYVGNPVTQMGYKVGKVDAVVPEGDHVEVVFSLSGDRHYPADVKAVTRSKSLLADRSLELVGNYSSGARLTAGRCIDLDHSYTPKSISEIAGSAADFIDAMAPSDGRKSFENAMAGLDEAFRGKGQNAATMMQHASSAMTSPDQLVADVGASIMNMAPLTEEALQRWATVKSIFNQAPGIISAAAYDLFPGVVNLTTGMDALIVVLYDIHRNYGDIIWPFVHGGVTDVIHLAATRSRDLAGLLESIPSLSAFLRQESAGRGGLTMTYEPPTVKVNLAADPHVCDLLNQTGAEHCDPATGGVRVEGVQLLDLIVAKGRR